MSSLEKEVEAIATRVVERLLSDRGFLSPVHETDVTQSDAQVRLRQIQGKEHISITETAILLNCSDGHIRNLIRKARKQQTTRPIPFLDLDGVTVFNRLRLLAWANGQKTNISETE